MLTKFKITSRAFTLVELMVATSIMSVMSGALMMGFVALQRNFFATSDYSTNHADEMRISDYISQDLRSALSVAFTGTGSSTVVTMSLPNFYDNARAPRIPVVNKNGTVTYKDTTTTPATATSTVIYYLSNGIMYRQQNGTNMALAVNVADFQLTATDSAVDPNAGTTFNLSSTYLKRVAEVKIRINFNPRFRASGSDQSGINGTSFYNTTLMRNARTDYNKSVY